MSERERDRDEIGALWVREGQNGEYMTGKIQGVKVVVWRNRSTNPKASPFLFFLLLPSERRPKRPQAPPISPEPDSDIPW